MEPNLELIEQGQTRLLWERIREQFRAFIGLTTWEELCRQWAQVKADHGVLPLEVELVGSHWSTNVQVDVIAFNWRDKAILLAECKWSLQPVGRKIIRELITRCFMLTLRGPASLRRPVPRASPSEQSWLT